MIMRRLFSNSKQASAKLGTDSAMVPGKFSDAGCSRCPSGNRSDRGLVSIIANGTSDVAALQIKHCIKTCSLFLNAVQLDCTMLSYSTDVLVPLREFLCSCNVQDKLNQLRYRLSLVKKRSISKVSLCKLSTGTAPRCLLCSICCQSCQIISALASRHARSIAFMHSHKTAFTTAST